MTDKEKTIKELKEALDSLDVTNKYRLNLIRAIEYLQEEPVSELWHDSNKEQPKAESDVAIWDGESGEILTRCVKVNPNRKWAYMEDMLNKKEEPVSEELEEAADSYIKTHGEILGFGRQTFKDGAKWQKQQMMAKAIDGYVIEDVGNGDFVLSADYLPKSIGLKDQQSVKVIVIKED